MVADDIKARSWEAQAGDCEFKARQDNIVRFRLNNTCIHTYRRIKLPQWKLNI